MISQRRLALLYVVVAGLAACAASTKPLPPLDESVRGAEVPPLGTQTGGADAGSVTPRPKTDADAAVVMGLQGDAGDAGRGDAGKGDSGTDAN